MTKSYRRRKSERKILTNAFLFPFWHCRNFLPCQLWNALHIFCFHKGRSHILWYWTTLWCEWYPTISTSEIYHNQWILRHTSLGFIWECWDMSSDILLLRNFPFFYKLCLFILFLSKNKLKLYISVLDKLKGQCLALFLAALKLARSF